MTYETFSQTQEFLKELTYFGTINHTVFLITKEGCDECSKTKLLLNEKSISYFEVKYETLSKESKNQLFDIRKQNQIDKISLPIIIITDSQHFFF